MKAFLISMMFGAAAAITVKAFGFVATMTILFSAAIFGVVVGLCRNRISRKTIMPTAAEVMRGPKWAGSSRTRRAWRDFRANRAA